MGLAALVAREGALLRQTHISWVLLSGERAYKIKRPVDLGFVDFSTPALRAAACREELRINQRSSPDLYFALRPIYADAQGGWCWQGEGPVVEWAVEMRRFDERDRLDALAARGALTPAHIRALAQAIHQLHAQAQIAPPEASWGTAQAAWQPLGQTLSALGAPLPSETAALEPPAILTPCAPPAQPPAQPPAHPGAERRPAAPSQPEADASAAQQRLHSLAQWAQAEHTRLSPLMALRRAQGHVREGHGDLHLANLVAQGAAVRLFDALEFDPALRWIDTACDLAFAWMDLRARGLGGLGGLLLSQVWGASGDWAAAALLPWYAVYRALVRAKVAQLDPLAPRDGVGSAAAYTHLALAIAGLQGCGAHTPATARADPPTLTLTHGVSGCGKSWAARQHVCADPSGRTLVLRSDLERARVALPAGLARYAPAAREAVYAHLHAQAQALLQAGWSVVVDAAYLERSQRARMAALADRLGVRLALLAPQADVATLQARIAQRAARGDDPSEATAAVLAEQLRSLEPLDAAERACVLG